MIGFWFSMCSITWAASRLARGFWSDLAESVHYWAKEQVDWFCDLHAGSYLTVEASLRLLLHLEILKWSDEYPTRPALTSFWLIRLISARATTQQPFCWVWASLGSDHGSSPRSSTCSFCHAGSSDWSDCVQAWLNAMQSLLLHLRSSWRFRHSTHSLILCLKTHSISYLGRVLHFCDLSGFLTSVCEIVPRENQWHLQFAASDQGLARHRNATHDRLPRRVPSHLWTIRHESLRWLWEMPRLLALRWRWIAESPTTWCPRSNSLSLVACTVHSHSAWSGSTCR